MESVPISHSFYVINGDKAMKSWEEAIQKLRADEEQNPQNRAIDEEEIGYYEQLEANLKHLEEVAAKYRLSNNDPNLEKEIKILGGRQQMLKQLIGLDDYIKSLQEDSKKNPQDAAENAQKIANAEQQKRCILDFQAAWEKYQKSGDRGDAEEVNALIQVLQLLRAENPAAPYSSGPIWEDFEAIVNKYTVFEFNGQKYAVSP